MNKVIRNKKGFSLTEVLVSIIVLGILFGCIIGVIVTGTKSSKAVEQRYNALIEIDSILTKFSTQIEVYEVGEVKHYYDKFFTTKSTEETEYYITTKVESDENIKTITITSSVLEEEYVRKVGVNDDEKANQQ